MFPVCEIPHWASSVQDEDVVAHGLIDGHHQLGEDPGGVATTSLEEESLSRTIWDLRGKALCMDLNIIHT